ncbi:MAG: hypothetical protein NUW00_05330, partial [Candidatus Kaiserbacteria bacterium]|nr:hypothetical protein [Candidatus Kaiserbacteria bacterium]
MKNIYFMGVIIFLFLIGIMSTIFQSGSVYAAGTTSNTISIPLDQGEDVIVEVDGEVLSIHQSPRYVVVSGTFSTVKVDGGTPVQVQNVAIVDLQTRVILNWLPAFNGAIFDIESYQNQIFIAGNFTQVGTATQPFLAVFDSSTKQLTQKQYQLDGAVNTLEMYESTLILGGEFEHIEAMERLHLGGISLEKQLITSWNPGANASVNSIARDTNTLYVGGAFTTIAGQARTYLASFYLPSGILSEWAPVVASPVQKLSINEGALIVELASSDPSLGVVQATVP